MTSVAWDEKAAVLAHYQLQAALAVFERLAEPELDDAGEELATLASIVEDAECSLRAATRAIKRGDPETAAEHIATAMRQLQEAA